VIHVRPRGAELITRIAGLGRPALDVERIEHAEGSSLCWSGGNSGSICVVDGCVVRSVRISGGS
jgi:hypothetical protein